MNRQHWTRRQIAILRKQWGRVPDSEVAALVDHSVRSCETAAYRRGFCRRDNVLTASKVADLLHVHCNTVLSWIRRGRLRARRSHVRCYRGFVWSIEYEDLMAFCKVYGYSPDLTAAFFSGPGKREEAA